MLFDATCSTLWPHAAERLGVRIFASTLHPCLSLYPWPAVQATKCDTATEMETAPPTATTDRVCRSGLSSTASASSSPSVPSSQASRAGAEVTYTFKGTGVCQTSDYQSPPFRQNNDILVEEDCKVVMRCRGAAALSSRIVFQQLLRHPPLHQPAGLCPSPLGRCDHRPHARGCVPGCVLSRSCLRGVLVCYWGGGLECALCTARG